jgi:hypothetical protein
MLPISSHIPPSYDTIWLRAPDTPPKYLLKAYTILSLDQRFATRIPNLASIAGLKGREKNTIGKHLTMSNVHVRAR